MTETREKLKNCKTWQMHFKNVLKTRQMLKKVKSFWVDQTSTTPPPPKKRLKIQEMLNMLNFDKGVSKKRLKTREMLKC